MKDHLIDINSDFKCLHCQGHVSAAAWLAGVQNRNHCPYCLWSRHLDLFEAGDRLAACKAPMRPVGLTLKRSRNKYAPVSGGELMLVHLCTDCSRISINRIAADDVSATMLEVYEGSLIVSTWLHEQMHDIGITLLDDNSKELVYRQLFGQEVIPNTEAVPTF